MSFPQGKFQLPLANPDKDKYDTRDIKKQHNLQCNRNQRAGPGVIIQNASNQHDHGIFQTLPLQR